MEGTRTPPWSDLPPELLSMIGSRLHTRVDVLRFRSICSSFRSSIHLPAPRVPFCIPCSPRPDIILREGTVYTLERPADGDGSSPEQWLVKLEESELGNMRILSLFSRRPIVSFPHKFPEAHDSLHFRIVEICREYKLGYCSATEEGMLRVVVHPDCVWTDQHHCAVYFIDQQRQLYYWKYGDENWSHLGCDYVDIVVYQGKVCVVDKSGSVSHIDSSFKLRRFSQPIHSSHYGHRHWRRLVVSSGDLYAVARCYRPCRDRRTCDFRVYRLNHQCGRWEEVKSLGNSAFFLGNHYSFAIPECEVDWIEGDCIYDAERFLSPFSTDEIEAFSLVNRRHKFVPLPNVYRILSERL